VFYETVGGNISADLFCSAFVRSAVRIINIIHYMRKKVYCFFDLTGQIPTIAV